VVYSPPSLPFFFFFVEISMNYGYTRKQGSIPFQYQLYWSLIRKKQTCSLRYCQQKLASATLRCTSAFREHPAAPVNTQNFDYLWSKVKLSLGWSEVLKVTGKKMAVFWDVPQCSLIDIDPGPAQGYLAPSANLQPCPPPPINFRKWIMCISIHNTTMQFILKFNHNVDTDHVNV
jgi:hypothetical protein